MDEQLLRERMDKVIKRATLLKNETRTGLIDADLKELAYLRKYVNNLYWDHPNCGLGKVINPDEYHQTVKLIEAAQEHVQHIAYTMYMQSLDNKNDRSVAAGVFDLLWGKTYSVTSWDNSYADCLKELDEQYQQFVAPIIYEQ